MKQKILLLIGILLIFQLPLFSQFYYVEDCKNPTGIFTPMGDAIGYTSGSVDPADNGWLRLTQIGGVGKRGYVLTEGSYSSDMGLTIEFDFKAWNNAGAKIGDGFSVFLFDGSISNTDFRIGGSGGNLGYLPNTVLGQLGVSGGYLGVGIDGYGGFIVSSPNAPTTSLRPHSISIAGPESNGYKYVASTLSYFAGISGISGTTIFTTTTGGIRPADTSYYRRVRVQIDPAAGTGVDISVYLKINPTGEFIQVLNKVNLPIAPFPTLKVGFAGVTGDYTAHHEVRNVVIKTSGDLSVYKKVDLPTCPVANDPFSIETIVTCGVVSSINDIAVRDTIPANFHVSSFGISGGTFHTAPGAPAVLADGRKVYSYNVNIPPVGTAIVAWNGYMTTLEKSEDLITSAEITPPGSFTDADLTDNYAKYTPVWPAKGSIVGTPTFSYDDISDNMMVTLQVENVGETDFLNPFYVTAYRDNVGNTTKEPYAFNDAIAVGETKTITFTIPNYKASWSSNEFVVIKINDKGDGLADQEVCDEDNALFFYYGLQPMQQEVCKDNIGEMESTFTHYSYYTYQWQYSANEATWTNISGATTRNYKPTYQQPGIGYYRMKVTNSNDPGNIVYHYTASVKVISRRCVMPVNPNIHIYQ